MKNLRLIMMTLVLTIGSTAWAYKSSQSYNYTAQPEQFSIGAMFGGYFGATASYYWKRDVVIDAAFAMEMGGDQNMLAWADYLVQLPYRFEIMSIQLDPYAGGGIKFRSENDPDVEEEYFVGPRGVAGVVYNSQSSPFQIYTELGFTYYLTQSSGTEMDFGIGARYFF